MRNEKKTEKRSRTTRELCEKYWGAVRQADEQKQSKNQTNRSYQRSNEQEVMKEHNELVVTGGVGK